MKKRTAMLAATTTLLVLAPQLMFEQKTLAVTTSTETKTPVQDGTFDHSGTDLTLDENFVGASSDPTYGIQNSAIQFNLTGLGNVRKATLRLYIKQYHNGTDSTDVPYISVFGTKQDGTGAWTTFPQGSDDELVTQNRIDLQGDSWWEVDVTDFVKEQQDNDPTGLVTFQITGNDTGTFEEFSFASDNASDPSQRPQLVMEIGPDDSLKPIVNDGKPPMTQEDTPTAPIQIMPDPADPFPGSHYKITDIQQGRLYKKNGIDEITNNAFITAAEGADGLIFVPNSNITTFESPTFSVQAAQDSAGTGLSPTTSVAMYVNRVNDAPTAGDDALATSLEANSGTQLIPASSLTGNDSAGPAEGLERVQQHLAVNWVGEATGGMVDLVDGKVMFTPAPDYYGPASFKYTVGDDGTTEVPPTPPATTPVVTNDPKTSNKATVSFTINRVARTPLVTAGITTPEDTPTASGAIKITPGAGDEGAVTHYKITGLAKGQLFKTDGTEVHNNDFITAAEGTAGLKFVPPANASTPADGPFTFQVQAALDAAGKGLSTAATAEVTVSEVNDAPIASNDPAIVAPISEDAAPVSIPLASLLANDDSGAGNESKSQLAVTSVGHEVGGHAEIQGGNVVFTPDADFNGTASFEYTVTDSGTTNGSPDLKTATATASFQINPVADVPDVTAGVTAVEGHQTTGSLVIKPNTADGAEVTRFKIGTIKGGKLYRQDGTTELHAGDFITRAEGLAGLKYTPDAQVSSATPGAEFSFVVQAALNGTETGISAPATATIYVSEVNDAPTATNDVLDPMQEDADEIAIPLSRLTGNDSQGPGEGNQTLTVTNVTRVVGGDVRLDAAAGFVYFKPDADFNGNATFTYDVSDNGTTNGAPDAQTATGIVTIPISSLADAPQVNSAPIKEDDPFADVFLHRSTADGTDVSYFKISGISSNGTLYKNDGSTEIHDGDYISVAEGEAGLKFKPAQDANSLSDSLGFDVKASLDRNGTGLSPVEHAAVTVTEVNDAPTAVADTLSGIEEDSDEIAIPFDALTANDSSGPTNESGQHLSITGVGNESGGQVRIDKAAKIIYFKPDANFNGTARFDYTVKDDGTTNSLLDAQSATATVSIPVQSVADTPGVTDASTTEDRFTDDGLFLTRNAADGVDVVYFKITGITDKGTLYKNDGSTEIHEGDYITVEEGEAGLKFKPAANANSPAGDTFTFNVQAALDTNGTGLSAAKQAKITVSEVNDTPVAADDTGLSAIPENSGPMIIPLEDLLANDDAGPADEKLSQHLTVVLVNHAQGGQVEIVGSNAVFTPDHNFHGTVSFEYTVEDDGTTAGVVSKQTDTATVSFAVTPRADMPTVTDATTEEDTPTSTGLVITPTAAGGSTAQYFKISGITGGTLYQHDGQTPIANGDYITVADGTAGLVFNPNPDAHGNTGFGFKVQAAPDTSGALLSDPADANITVTEVNDAPTAGNDGPSELAADHLDKIATGTDEVMIPVSVLKRNDSVGPLDEQLWQTLAITNVTPVAGGQVTLVGEYVKFVPDANFKGLAKFTYTVQDDGRTNGTDALKTDTAEVSFNIVDEDQPVITLYGNQDVYVLKGEPYQDPGFAADDRTDHDLTDEVVVTGSVDTTKLGTYQLHYNVADTSGNAAPEVVRTVHVVSNELADLSVSAGDLTPDFDPGQDAYTLKVPTNASKLTITTHALDSSSAIAINGSSVDPKVGTATVKVGIGVTDVTIVVTAQGGATKTYHLEITRPPGSPSGGGGGGSDVRHGHVDTGKGGTAVQVEINRTTASNGHIVDSVIMNAAKADEVVRQATKDGGKIARIVIDDIPNEPADEVTVNISGAALGKMKSAKLGLVIEAGGSTITLSADTLSQMGHNGEDLYFHVVPVRKPEARRQVEQRVANSKVIKDYARGGNVTVVAQPMTIDTNYSSRKTKVLLPLTGIDLPSDARERAAYLNSLAVFVEHSDGEKLVQTGTLVYDAAGEPTGLEIEVQKFSTFTVISADVQYQTYARYISGYPDGTFHPSANITRAELASILARQLKLDAGSAASAQQYPDVSGSHWAWAAIEELRAAGILIGDAQGHFRPDQPVTRAELATIAARLKHLDTTGTLPNFEDANGHWAASSIAAVKQTGLMNGYEDGTFRPNKSLTRAEAVAVINRLFDRPALKNAPQASWPDVLLTEWYAPDVESASHDLRKYSDGRIDVVGNN